MRMTGSKGGARALFAAAVLLANPACKAVEECSNGEDDDGDGYADCADDECAGTFVCPPCGDGTLGDGEECDGGDYGGATCATLGMGYTGGTLQCASGCTFDTSGCVGQGTCGNGIVDNMAEFCDGADLGGAMCEDYGFDGGTLACGMDCWFDYTGCTGGGVCGDGNVDFFEECDGMNLDMQDCTTLGFGFTGGTLTCDMFCYFDWSMCT